MGSYTLKHFGAIRPRGSTRTLMLSLTSGCSGSMTGDKDKLSVFKVYVEVLKFNLLSDYLICDKICTMFYSLFKVMSYPISKVQFVDEDLCESVNRKKVLLGSFGVKFDGQVRRRISVGNLLLTAKQFIVHNPLSPMLQWNVTAAKEVKNCTLKNKALHDEPYKFDESRIFCQNLINDDQRDCFEEEKRRISIAQGKKHVDSTFTLSTAKTPPQEIMAIHLQILMMIVIGGVFSTTPFDADGRRCR
ncbi:hypothetical protein Tco_0557016 [Tanacetum coccineum]